MYYDLSIIHFVYKLNAANWHKKNDLLHALMFQTVDNDIYTIYIYTYIHVSVHALTIIIFGRKVLANFIPYISYAFKANTWNGCGV